MINLQTLSGNWNDVKGRLRKRWGQLTNDDVQMFDGNIDRLVGMIQKKTGEARDNVESFLEEVSKTSSNAMGQAADTMRDYATSAARQTREYAGQAANQVRDYSNQAAYAIEQGSEQAMDAFRQGYRQAENAIRSRPGESIALCFCAGILTGVLLSLSLRSR